MTRYLVCEHNEQTNHAGSKARNDIVSILTSHGWAPLYVSRGDGGNAMAKIAIAPRVVAEWMGIAAKLCLGDIEFGLRALDLRLVRAYHVLRGQINELVVQKSQQYDAQDDYQYLFSCGEFSAHYFHGYLSPPFLSCPYCCR